MNTSIHYQKIEGNFSLSDIFSLFHHTPCAFLNSSLENDLGQYSILGLFPYLTLEERKGMVYENNHPISRPFHAVLREHLEREKGENPTSLPLISGAIGYFSYDHEHTDDQENRVGYTENIPQSSFTFYDNFLIQDHRNGELFISGAGKHMEATRSIEKIIHRITTAFSSVKKETSILTKDDLSFQNISIKHKKDSASQELLSSIAKSISLSTDLSKKKYPVHISSNFTKNSYLEAISKMVQYMEDGDIYIANLTQKLAIACPKSPYDFFKTLQRKNPSPFGGYLNDGKTQIISASPERFLKMKNRKIDTRPIKGTRKRSADPVEDQRLRKELQDSTKDRSELLMIVDLERNDLSKVCKPHTVRVDELFEIEEYATVFHLISNVTGILEEKKDTVDLIEAMIPGGSITGAPKIRAMEIIEELEKGARGLYTGNIGYLSANGDCDFNIVIRTAIHQDGIYYLGVGGGITYESDLEFEYEETLQKANAILAALQEMEEEE